MISISRSSAFLKAIRSSRHVCLDAYFLHPGPVLDALLGAARNGCRVTVRLEGHPFDDACGSIRRTNEAVAERLRAAGADAALTTSGGEDLHIKAAIIDGVAYLDDRNFNLGGDTIVRDSSQHDVAALKAALAGRAFPPGRTFWTNKNDALAAETRLLQTASHARNVVIQSESFSSSSAAYRVLKRLAADGVRCRLLVAPDCIDAKERRALRLLQTLGVKVRTATSNEKMTVVDGMQAWVGSSNATATFYDPGQKDWGLRTDVLSVTHALQHRFQTNWKSADAF